MADDDRTWMVMVKVQAPRVCAQKNVEDGIRESIEVGLDSFTVQSVEAREI